MWIKDRKLLYGNIDCKRKHFVLEGSEDGLYTMHKKPQGHKKHACNDLRCMEHFQKICTLFIHTDPSFWRHFRHKYNEDEKAKGMSSKK